MKLIITSNEGIVITELKHIDKLNLSRKVVGFQILAFIRAGVKHGKLMDQVNKDEKKGP